MKYKCIVVDDERLARKGIESHIEQIDRLELVASCGSTAEAHKVLINQDVQLMFLDIQMPKMTGLEFLRSLRKSPATIITTAYSEYALEGFELDVIDYLIKPVSFAKLKKAVNKGEDFLRASARPVSEKPDDYFFVKSNTKYEKIIIDEILCIEGMQNYVILKTTYGNFVAYLTMKNIEDFLPSEKFTRIHKSTIVANSRVEKIDGNQLKVGPYQLSLSRSYKGSAMKNIFENKLLIRSTPNNEKT